MSTLYKRTAKLQKLARIQAELDTEQLEFDRHDKDVAEDIRWTRIFLGNAMKALKKRS